MIEQIQQIAAKPPIALGGSISAGSYTWLTDIADITQVLGHIAAGILSILLLVNYIYMKWFK